MIRAPDVLKINKKSGAQFRSVIANLIWCSLKLPPFLHNNVQISKKTAHVRKNCALRSYFASVISAPNALVRTNIFFNMEIHKFYFPNSISKFAKNLQSSNITMYDK